ncbi:hypothetical protein Glove_103g303 [Diversispora epigaea]|uniref:Uncharacterized protein n=1 Tax=Diversispora epigaea TaxID=1348612 RepID=A0A397JCF8_9GLOM|nr:hypothetical protein Glove_103g303 [Diversispora epigaea]
MIININRKPDIGNKDDFKPVKNSINDAKIVGDHKFDTEFHVLDYVLHFIITENDRSKFFPIIGKNLVPNLVKIEDKLINACAAYEETERYLFACKRYLGTLQGKSLIQMFFGLEKDSVKIPKSKEKEYNQQQQQ